MRVKSGENVPVRKVYLVKIAIFSDTWQPTINGVVFSIINEIKALSEHEFFVFVPRQKQDANYIPVDAEIISFTSIPFPNYPEYSISLPDRTLRKTFKKHRFDLVHTHTPFTAGYFALMTGWKMQAPIVSTYHTWLSEYAGHLFAGFFEEQVKHVLYNFIWAYTRRFYHRTHVVTTPSRMLKLELERHDVTPVLDIPNPISDVFFDVQTATDHQETVQQLKKRFHVPPDKKVVLYVGRVSFEKRLEVLIEAFRRVEAQRDDVFLVVVGSGPHFNAYRKKARKTLQHFVFTGPLKHDDLPYVYRMGDVFVSPSDTETQGLTFIEAMSQGTPVVGVRAGGVVDYLRNGYNGLLAEPRDPTELARRIQQALDSDRLDSFRREGLKTAQRYSSEAFAKQLNHAFDLAFQRYDRG